MSKPTVELLFKDGVLAGHWESKDGEPRQYGRNETPERGFVVVRLYGRADSLPPGLLDYGGKKSRFKLDESRMSEDERRLFKDKTRFSHRNHTTKHTISIERLRKLVVDSSGE